MAVEPLDLISLFAQKRPSIFKINPENTKKNCFLRFQRSKWFLEMSVVFYKYFVIILVVVYLLWAGCNPPWPPLCALIMSISISINALSINVPVSMSVSIHIILLQKSEKKYHLKRKSTIFGTKYLKTLWLRDAKIHLMNLNLTRKKKKNDYLKALCLKQSGKGGEDERGNY